jgi:hypothetical protein
VPDFDTKSAKKSLSEGRHVAAAIEATLIK